MKSRFRQLGFAILDEKSVKIFGGSYLKNSHAKVKRPLSPKRSLHLVMRSSKATGARSMLRFQRQIYGLVERQSRFARIKLYRYANAGNHLHMIVRAPTRDAYARFVRAISGLIARFMLNAEKTRPKHIRFWDQRPYTRVVEWGRDFQNVCLYVLQNTLEAVGFIPYKPRKVRRLREHDG